MHILQAGSAKKRKIPYFMFFSGTLQEKLNGWKVVEKSFIRGCVICLAFKYADKLLLCTIVLKSHAILGKKGKNSRNTNFENKRKAWGV